MRPIYYLLLLLLSLLFATCQKEELVECENGGMSIEGNCQCPEGWGGVHCEIPVNTVLNPLEPTGMHLLNNSLSYGGAATRAAILDIETRVDGALYWFGVKNQIYMTGLRNPNGTEQWNTALGFRPNGISSTESTTAYGGGDFLLIAGQYSPTDAAVSGKVALLNAGGNLLDELTYEEYDKVFFNDIIELGGSKRNPKFNGSAVSSNLDLGYSVFLLLGGAESNGVIYPYCQYVSLNHATGRLQKQSPPYWTGLNARLFLNHPDLRFRKAQSGYANSSSANAHQDELFINMYEKQNGQTVRGYVMRLLESSTTSSTQAGSMINSYSIGHTLSGNWLQMIPAVQSQYKLRLMDLHVNVLSNSYSEVYVVGEVETTSNKAAVAPGNAFWTGGQVAKLNSNQQLLWNQSQVFSNYGDSYNNVVLFNNYLYISGRMDFHAREDNQRFGYGLLSKVNSATGNVENHISLGSSAYRSGFNDIVLNGSQITSVGFTANYRSLSGFQGWLVQLNASTL